ncbi:Crp/Fnr family transcriptional regulator [Natranaerofaba carboxydovora]|uniref:Crp/Fnr family transcriptional regulator n=1 Tax=Natranaerofaba carboxydovora TaxID=2742683 RepID=UPI001F13DAD4|nr:Crp/Fnr family transcriptional regulator [Natranaerofaba carboxydovora]UMZ72644.1 CRP-like cAMP-activated global transcriptional regulator [Natranaerofaba carboxydovora]
MSKELISGLKKVDLFSHLEESELNILVELAEYQEYKQGEIIFFEGEPGEAMYVIEKGKVKILKDNVEGKEQILNVVQKGDVFAEVVIFDDRPYPATAEVVEDSLIAAIKKESFDQMLYLNPQIAVKMMRLMGKRLREAQGKIADLALKNTDKRVLSTICKLARKHGRELTDQKVKIELSLTHQQLANMVGSSRETVSRILSKFKKEGLIDFDKSHIIVNNLGQLEDE